ncbi:MAG: hypothetical protein BWY21_01542 [Parcubacteria group bacterium ADurb.Bin216]|nr:MAG: hypothetical protein BWY21_01542 [Parcubacteria group bacterium ADurb.Bin216]
MKLADIFGFIIVLVMIIIEPSFMLFLISLFWLVVFIGINTNTEKYQNNLLISMANIVKDKNRLPILRLSSWLRNPSLLILLISNLTASFFIVKGQFNLLEVFSVYVLQVLFIGLFSVLNFISLKKVVVNGRELFGLDRVCANIAFGTIILGYSLAVALWIYFVMGVHYTVLLYPGICFFLSHLFSFLISRKAISEISASEVQDNALMRVLSIYLIIFIFLVVACLKTFLPFFSITNEAFIILFLLVKMFIDLNSHAIKQDNIFHKEVSVSENGSI